MKFCGLNILRIGVLIIVLSESKVIQPNILQTSTEKTISRKAKQDDITLVEKMFEYGDVNHNLLLTKDEISQFYQRYVEMPVIISDWVANKLILKGDLNGDSQLEFHELLLAVSSVPTNDI